jgi:signal transduction histidine kinase
MSMQPARAVERRRWRGWRDLVYVGLGLLLGSVWLCALALAATVMIVLIGGLILAPVAARVLELTVGAAALERRLANRLLGADLPAPRVMPAQLDATARLRSLAAAGSTWRAIAWLVLRLPLALVVATIVWALAWFAASLGAAPFSGALVGAGLGYQAAALIACGALILLVLQSLWLSSEAHARLAATLLGPSAHEQLERLEQRTAELDLRAGLARDLHDSVGHSVTASLLQASAARQSLERDPAFAARALEAIEDQSRAALEQLDRVLGTLRDADRAVPEAGGLERLDELVARTRTAGIPLSVERRGDLSRLPGPIADEAFRTVQEGLTNVLRHASGAPTRVLLARTERALEVLVENGRGSSLDVARDGGGEGIRGIGERVGSLGGELAHGPLPDGGFRLRVRLPFDTA